MTDTLTATEETMDDTLSLTAKALKRAAAASDKAAAVAEAKRNERNVLLLKMHEEGASLREIGAVANLTAQAVNLILARAKRAKRAE